MKKILVAIAFLCASASLTHAQLSSVKSLEQSISKGKAKKVKALIKVAGGELQIKGETENLADVSFDYDEDEWNPTVAYTEDNNVGKLTIKANIEGNDQKVDHDNFCRVKMNKSLDYSLGIRMGAGVANLDFEGYHIEKALLQLGVGSFDINLANTSVPLLKIEAGIGEATINLSGKWKNSLQAKVTAGIGEIKFIVPEQTGVKFVVRGFLGEVDAHGFSKDGREYTNNAWGKTNHQLVFEVAGAIGSIEIVEK